MFPANARQSTLSIAIMFAAICFAANCTFDCARALAENELDTESATKIAVADGADLLKVRELITAEQWQDAVELIIDVMQRADLQAEASGRTFVPVQYESDASDLDLRKAFFELNLPLKTACQIELCRWHKDSPQAFSLYRTRMNPGSQRAVAAALKAESVELLSRSVARFFPAADTDSALLALGDYQLQDAQFAAARREWETIQPVFRLPAGLEKVTPAAAGTPAWIALRNVDLAEHADSIREAFLSQGDPANNASNGLASNGPDSSSLDSIVVQPIFPDSSIPIAGIASRMVIASVLEGDLDRAELELKLFDLLFEDAEGTINGKSGNLSASLHQLMQELMKNRGRSPHSKSDWLTFGGNAQRNGHAHGEVDPSGQPIWSVDVERQSAVPDLVGLTRPRVGEASSGLLSYHPALVGDTLLWHDGNTIRAIDVDTGSAKWPSGSSADRIPSRKGTIWTPSFSQNYRNTFRPRVGSPRYTSFVAGDLLFARMGNPLTGYQDDDPRADSFVVGVDLSREGKMLPGFELVLLDDRQQFEGTPIVFDSRLYITIRETTARSSRVSLSVACYELPALRSIGVCRKLWQVPICSADSPASGTYDEITHTLLSRTGSTIFCNTNLGVIAALSAENGDVHWISRYSRDDLLTAGQRDSVDHFFREPNPCLVHGDVIFVAPTDTDRILALHTMTGRLIWSLRAAGVVQLLGTTQQSLVVSGSAIHWLDLRNGQLQTAWPQISLQTTPGFARPDDAGYGRGVVTTDSIYWPTREHIFVFGHTLRESTDGKTQSPSLQRIIKLRPRGVQSGNLLISDNLLIIAGEDRIVAFNETGAIKQ